MTSAATGLNPVVRAIGQISFEGNTIPHEWYQAIKLDTGKTDLPAIIVLSEIIYWYRPTRELDQATGMPLSPRKKFEGDMFQAGAAYFEGKFGLTKDQTRKALKRLEDRGYIRREYRDIVRQGRTFNNVMYVEPIPDRILDITHPKTENSTTSTGGTTPLSPGGDTLSPAPRTLSPGGDTLSPAPRTLSPGGDTPSPEGDTPSPPSNRPSPGGETYTKISTEISTETTTTAVPGRQTITKAPSCPRTDGSSCSSDTGKNYQETTPQSGIPVPTSERCTALATEELVIPESLTSTEGGSAIQVLRAAGPAVQAQAQDLLWELGGQVATKRRMAMPINTTLYLHGLIRAAKAGTFTLAAGLPLRTAHEHALKLEAVNRRNEAAALARLEQVTPGVKEAGGNLPTPAPTSTLTPDPTPAPASPSSPARDSRAPVGRTAGASPPSRSRPSRSRPGGGWREHIRDLRSIIAGAGAPAPVHRPEERPRC